MNNYKKYVNITKQINTLIGKNKLKEGFLVIQSLNSGISVITTSDERSISDFESQMDYIFPRLLENDEEYKLLNNFISNLIGNAIEIPVINSKVSLRFNEEIYLLNHQKKEKVELHISMLSDDYSCQDDICIIIPHF